MVITNRTAIREKDKKRDSSEKRTLEGVYCKYGGRSPVLGLET